MTTIHKFEAAGLGKAPFKYVGMVDQQIAHGERVIGNVGGVQMTTKPGGSCAYCGQYIINMFNVESADGHKFHVGCDCITKVGDAGLIKLVQADVKKMKAAKAKAAKAAKQEEAAEYVADMLAVHGDKLAHLPHPNEYRTSLGDSFTDYVKWLVANGYAVKAAMVIENAKF